MASNIFWTGDVAMYSYVYYADTRHKLSIQLLYTFCTDFNYSHALDWLDQNHQIYL